MRYAIITNPVSGKMTVEQKRSALAEAAVILHAEIYGLDASTAADFVECAREVAERCELLVVAGGDGTLSEVINAIDTVQTPIAYLPLGSGNAVSHALGYKGSLADIARRIREGQVRTYDLIDCSGRRRAVSASLGIEGMIIQLRDRYQAGGAGGFGAYFRAFLRACLGKYRRAAARIAIDHEAFGVEKLMSLVVVKQPYYGYGMKVVPEARFDDGRLHVICIDSGHIVFLWGAVTAWTTGNRIGRYRRAERVRARLNRPLALQIDGSLAWEADDFTFRVLPKALRIKC